MRPSKRTSIAAAAGGLVVVVIGVGIGLATHHSHNHHPLAGATAKTSTPPGNGSANNNKTAGSATANTNSSPSTSTTAVAVDPTPQTLRTPVHCAAPGSPKAGTLPGDDPNQGKRWVTVAHLSGGCDSSSPTFALKGIDTRLAYASDASNFTAFLIDSKDGIDATDGYADAECAGSCADYQALVDQAGNYTLRVQADGGPWEISIQEYR